MAKFCTSCGTPHDEAALFCKKCGANLSAPVSTTPQQTEKIAPEQPIYTAPVCDIPDSAPEVADAPAKKPKKKLLLAAVALVLAAAIALTTVFVVLPIFRKGDGKGYTVAGKDYITFTSPDTRYYISGVDGLDTNLDDQSMSLSTWGLYEELMVSRSSFVSLDDCAYCFGDRYSGDTYIGKITYEDPSETDRETREKIIENNLDATSVPVVEEWLSYDEVNRSYDDKFTSAILHFSNEWQYVDGYIYFYISLPREQFDYLVETAYKFGRINIEDKSIEIIGNNINVCDYVVYDEWVYFSDNGWDLDSMSYNTRDAGLYKMRTDGSEVTKLLGFNPKNPDEYLHDGYAPFSELSVYDDQLYFIDNSDPWFGALKRMDLDGNDVEQVAENTTYEYTFDANSDTLYYVTGAAYLNNQTDVKEIYRVDLDNFEEDLFANYALKQDRIQIACADGKLYFASINQLFGIYAKGNVYGSKDDPSFCGIYYDLEEEKATAAYRWHDIYYVEKEFLDKTIKETVIENPHYYWEEYDPSTGPFTFYY